MVQAMLSWMKESPPQRTVVVEGGCVMAAQTSGRLPWLLCDKIDDGAAAPSFHETSCVDDIPPRYDFP
jgi:hypothetical protein